MKELFTLYYHRRILFTDFFSQSRLPAETSLLPVSLSICFRKWKFPEATFWVIKHTEQIPFALTSQGREHRIRSHPKVMWSSLGSSISTPIRNATWLSVSSINLKFSAGSLHAMISLLCPFLLLSILLPFGFCWNSTRILCFQIGSRKQSTIECTRCASVRRILRNSTFSR